MCDELSTDAAGSPPADYGRQGASTAALPPPRARDLSRDDPRRGPRGDLPRRRRPPPLPRLAGPRDAPHGLGLPRLLPHAEPPPSARGNAPGPAFGRHALPQRPLRASVQSATRAHRSPLRRPLRGLRAHGRRPPADGNRVRPAEPRPRGPLPPSRRLAVERAPTTILPTCRRMT